MARLQRPKSVNTSKQDDDDAEDEYQKQKRARLRTKEKSIKEYHQNRNKLRKSVNLQITTQWTEVSNEERDYKKMKHGKMSKEDFDALYSDGL